tara:strand:+ start:553 stop:1701 length:1149 start_codon:yes stop_codon:yes gene_type:complete
MSKLLSQGGFGCVYHPGIKCDGSKDKKKYVSKLQINDYTAVNEVQIGKLIKSIPNYNLFFLPIIDYCKINATELDSELIQKCNTLHEKTNLVLMKMNYMKNKNFFEYITKSDIPSKIFSQLIDKYLYLLNSIELLNSKNIIHFDLKDENILLNKNNDNPIMIDFGISLDMNGFKMDYVEDYFYVYAPEYYIWSFDIHLISFLSRKITEDSYNLTEKDVVNISNEFVDAHKVFVLFSDDFKNNYKQQCIIFGNTYVGKNKTTILKELIIKENYSTWDNYALSCLIGKSIKYMFDNKFPNINLLKNLTQIIFVNIHPDPSKRYSIKKTKEKLNEILLHIDDPQEEIFTFINKININKNKIDIEIINDNSTIQDISSQNNRRKLN